MPPGSFSAIRSSLRPVSLGRYVSGQLHLELLASMKVLTELTTLAAGWATVAMSAAEGLGGSAWTAVLSVPTEEVMALVWSGKSLLAELASAVASVWTVPACDFRLLKSRLEIELVRSLTEFCRVVRSVQYAGLLLLQPAAATIPAATATAGRTRITAVPRRARDLLTISGPFGCSGA